MGTGVYQQCIEPFGVMRKRPVSQPVDQFVEIRRIEHLLESLKTRAVMHGATCQCQQVKVMVAEYRYDRLAKAFDEAQCLQRLRTTVDQIADQPQGILVGLESKVVEQTPERVIAALQVTDCIRGHCASVCVSAIDQGPPA